MNLSYKPKTLYPKDKAEKMAQKLQDFDPEWTYSTEGSPNGEGFVAIVVYDEDGRKIGYM